MVLFSAYLFLYITVILVAFLSVVYLYFTYRYQYWKKLRVPSSKPKFPFGDFRDTILLKQHLGIQLKFFYNYFKSRGSKYGGVYFFSRPSLVLTCPELIKNVMTKDFGHFTDRGFYYNEEADPLSAHLFALNGQKWKNLRNKFTPTFTSGKMKQMFETLVNCSVNLKDCLNKPISKGEPIAINDILAKYTTDVIGSCAFGIECNSFQNSDTDFIKISKKVFHPNVYDRFRFFFAFTIPKIAKFFNMGVVNYEVNKFYQNLIKDTVEYREKNNVERNDFMNLLIQLKNKGYIEKDGKSNEELGKTTTITMNELAAQAFLFFIAGYETSSTAMTWCMFELSQNQEIQNKLRKEIVQVLKQFNGVITYDALTQMHYLDCVLNESMRKYPPFLFQQRDVTKDYLIPNTDIILKKGIKIFIPAYALQTDPEYYPNPDKFDPDRFTEVNKNTRPDYTWLPFGEGPRNCIGLRFALLQMKIALCQLLTNYKFSLNSNTKLPIVIDPKSVVFNSMCTIFLKAERVNT